MREEDKFLYEKKIYNIVNKQVDLLKKRIQIFNNITNKDFENFTFM